jgi:hypothetical protein
MITDRRKSKLSEKDLTLVTSSKANVGLNQGFRCKEPATDRLNCGMTKNVLTK